MEPWEPWCRERVVPRDVATVTHFTEMLFDKREELEDQSYLTGMEIAKGAHTLVTFDVLRAINGDVTPRAWRAGRRDAMRVVREMMVVVSGI